MSLFTESVDCRGNSFCLSNLQIRPKTKQLPLRIRKAHVLAHIFFFFFFLFCCFFLSVVSVYLLLLSLCHTFVALLASPKTSKTCLRTFLVYLTCECSSSGSSLCFSLDFPLRLFSSSSTSSSKFFFFFIQLLPLIILCRLFIIFFMFHCLHLLQLPLCLLHRHLSVLLLPNTLISVQKKFVLLHIFFRFFSVFYVLLLYLICHILLGLLELQQLLLRVPFQTLLLSFRFTSFLSAFISFVFIFRLF